MKLSKELEKEAIESKLSQLLKIFRTEELDLDTLNNEAVLLNEAPNLWIGYNAFNQMLHNTLKKGFSQQERLDKKLFDAIYKMA